MPHSAHFNRECRSCQRLAGFLDDAKQSYTSYHAGPLAPFGDINARLLMVGLTPGMHGANASGLPFTGDYAGLMPHLALFDFGFSNQLAFTALTNSKKLVSSHQCSRYNVQTKRLSMEMHSNVFADIRKLLNQ